MILKFLFFNNMKTPAHIAITIYKRACNKPLTFILFLSPEEKTFIQFDKLYPAKGVITPDRKEANDARNTTIFLFLNKVKIRPY